MPNPDIPVLRDRLVKSVRSWEALCEEREAESARAMALRAEREAAQVQEIQNYGLKLLREFAEGGEFELACPSPQVSPSYFTLLLYRGLAYSRDKTSSLGIELFCPNGIETGNPNLCVELVEEESRVELLFSLRQFGELPRDLRKNVQAIEECTKLPVSRVALNQLNEEVIGAIQIQYWIHMLMLWGVEGKVGSDWTAPILHRLARDLQAYLDGQINTIKSLLGDHRDSILRERKAQLFTLFFSWLSELNSLDHLSFIGSLSESETEGFLLVKGFTEE